MNPSSFILTVFAAFLVAFSTTLLKRSVNKLSLSNWCRNRVFLFGVFLYGLGNLLVIFVLRSNEVSVVFPVASVQYVFVAILARHYLGERINLERIFAVLSILVGVCLVVL